MVVGIVIGVIVVLLLIWVASTYNVLVKLRNTVEEAFSTMDVYLKKRWDLIPNLVATVKGYAKHESETLEKVMAARSGGYSALSTDEKIAANKELSGAITKLMAVAENYPELKANQNFLELQGELNQIEDDIANSRKYYNGTVKQYNNKVDMFPSNLIAGLFHFVRKQMFEVSSEAERENVKVEF